MLFYSSPRVVEHRIGELPSNSQSSNSRQIRLVDLQSKTRVSDKTAPPAYSEIDQPIFNVQSEMKDYFPEHVKVLMDFT